MGLDIGVVRITYLDRPGQPVYDFLRALAAGDFFDESWGGGWAGNALVEFQREQLLREASDWAQDQGLGAPGRDALRQWIEALSWDGDTIMLHFNW